MLLPLTQPHTILPYIHPFSSYLCSRSIWFHYLIISHPLPSWYYVTIYRTTIELAYKHYSTNFYSSICLSQWYSGPQTSGHFISVDISIPLFCYFGRILAISLPILTCDISIDTRMVSVRTHWLELYRRVYRFTARYNRPYNFSFASSLPNIPQIWPQHLFSFYKFEWISGHPQSKFFTTLLIQLNFYTL